MRVRRGGAKRAGPHRLRAQTPPVSGPASSSHPHTHKHTCLVIGAQVDKGTVRVAGARLVKRATHWQRPSVPCLVDAAGGHAARRLPAVHGRPRERLADDLEALGRAPVCRGGNQGLGEGAAVGGFKAVSPPSPPFAAPHRLTPPSSSSLPPFRPAINTLNPQTPSSLLQPPHPPVAPREDDGVLVRVGREERKDARARLRDLLVGEHRARVGAVRVAQHLRFWRGFVLYVCVGQGGGFSLQFKSPCGSAAADPKTIPSRTLDASSAAAAPSCELV